MQIKYAKSTNNRKNGEGNTVAVDSRFISKAKKKSDSPAKQKMATVVQPTSNAFPVLSNGIDDSRIKNSTLIENGTKVSVSKMKTHPPSHVSNPVSKQNGNYSNSSSDGESPPVVNGTASPKPHKTSQNHPPKIKLLNRSSAVTVPPSSSGINGEDRDYINERETTTNTNANSTATDTAIVKGVASEYINQDTSTTSSTTTYQEKDRKQYSTPVKYNNSINSSTPSKQHSLDYSSSPSSTTSSLNRENSLDYKDSTGVDLHEFMVKTLRENPRDRLMLLKLERDFTEFIDDTQKRSYKYPPMTSYHRMLIHRVAAYFGLDHNVDSSGKSVVISKTPASRVPEVRFQVYCSREYTEEEIADAPKSILLRSTSSDDMSTPPRYDSPFDVERRYSSLEDKKSKSIEEREEDYNKAKERIFSKDASLEIGEEYIAPDGSTRIVDSVGQGTSVPLSEKEAAVAAVAAACGGKEVTSKRKTVTALQLGQFQQAQYAYNWQQVGSDSNASTPGEPYGYKISYQPVDGYQQQGATTIAVNTQTGQPILGPDGQPTYYQLHYANGQVAYVPNNTASYYIQQNGKYVPYYYMSGGGQQSQPPQQVSPATVQTNTQHHPQQQQPSGSLPQQTQLQQQAQYYIVQTTPSGQVLYIPTQHPAASDQTTGQSVLVSPQSVHYQDYTNQMSQLTIDNRRLSTSNDDSSETKTQPTTPTSPVDSNGNHLTVDVTSPAPHSATEYQAQQKQLYYVPQGRVLSAPTYQQTSYPVQYIQQGGVPRSAYSSGLQQVDQHENTQYAQVNVSQGPAVLQQIRLPSGLIHQQYVPSSQSHGYTQRIPVQPGQQYANQTQRLRFVTGVLPNPSSVTPVYYPAGSSGQATMVVGGQYVTNLQMAQSAARQSSENKSVDSNEHTNVNNARHLITGVQPRPVMQIQPTYRPSYPYMPQQSQRYVSNPNQMMRAANPRKFRPARPTSNSQQIRISRPNSSSGDLEQKTVSHILEIYDFPDTVTSDSDAIFDEIKSSGARILKINSSSPQTISNSGNPSVHQRPTILAIFKSATEAQQALETVTSQYFKLRVSQKSSHFSGSDHTGNPNSAKAN